MDLLGENMGKKFLQLRFILELNILLIKGKRKISRRSFV